MLALLAQFVLLTVAVLLAMIASTWDVLLVLPSLLTMYILIATAEGKDANSKVTTKGEKCFVPVSSSAIETPHESGVQGEIAESSAEGKHERTRTTRKRGNQRKCMVPAIEELMAALEELARVSTSATKPGAECTIATEEVAEGEGAEGAVAKDKQDETSGPATGETADDKAFAARAIERSHAKQSLDISVKIFTHRTSVQSNGKPVVEYGCAVAAASGIESSQSWHRYTDFAELHAKISGELGISPRFCCPKAFIFTDAHKMGRAIELQAYLDGCLRRLRVTGKPMPAALHAFLYTPTTMMSTGSTSGLSTPLEVVAEHEHDTQAVPGAPWSPGVAECTSYVLRKVHWPTNRELFPAWPKAARAWDDDSAIRFATL